MMRRRKGGSEPKKTQDPAQSSDSGAENNEKKATPPADAEEDLKLIPKQGDEKSNNLNLTSKKTQRRVKSWNCVDSCCWFVGCICSIWWLLLFSYNAMPSSFPQYVTEAITGPLPDPPGVKLAKEGLKAKHPVVFVPGIVTGGLELWEGHQCAEGLFRKRLWGGTFGDLYRR